MQAATFVESRALVLLLAAVLVIMGGVLVANMPEPSFAVTQAEAVAVAVPLSLDVELAAVNSTMRAEAMAEWMTLTQMVVGETEVKPSDHPWVKHGPAEVETVRAAMRIKATEDNTWWNRPPCKDGRYRYVLGLADGSWAIWVLEAVTNVPGVLQEVTAFIAGGQDYAKTVDDNCGNGSWLGHAYGG